MYVCINRSFTTSEHRPKRLTSTLVLVNKHLSSRFISLYTTMKRMFYHMTQILKVCNNDSWQPDNEKDGNTECNRL